MAKKSSAKADNLELNLHDDEKVADKISATLLSPDDRSGAIYHWKEGLRMAAQVARATGRPLLLRGSPGCGKSSFAAYLARCLNFRYFEFVVTATTKASDLLWRYDSVRRFADAQTRKAGDPPLGHFSYIDPGVLWWILDPMSAVRRGAPSRVETDMLPAVEPNKQANQGRDQKSAVLLIDEIDKADPDVPNNLLVPLGSLQFAVDRRDDSIKATGLGKGGNADGKMSRFLFVITTNEERELPPAFIRRCVVHCLPQPSEDDLVAIAHKHLRIEGKNVAKARATQIRDLARRIVKYREQAEFGERAPSTAEFLDAVHACEKLKIKLDSKEWQHIERVVLRKPSSRDVE